MSIVCPAILSDSKQAYEAQLKRFVQFANHLHVDISDGVFSPHQTIGVEDIWWPAGTSVDVHVMYKNPTAIVDGLISLKPRLVIVHAEADGDFISLAKNLHAHGIKAGLALLPDTPVEYLRPGVGLIDHIMIFSGDLGSYGGNVHLDLLSKVQDINALDSSIEIGWDGGVTDKNIRALADGGIEVIVSGGFVANAEKPRIAYGLLKQRIRQA